MSVKTKLDIEIEDSFDKLVDMDKGSDGYVRTVDGVAKLLDKHIEIEKQRTDAEVRKEECKLKLKQMDDDRKDRWIKNGLTAAGIIIPSIITIWGTIKSIEFEKEGTITTIMGRGFFNKLLPKK